MNKLVSDKLKMIKAMDFIMRKMNDERAYMYWTYIVPDCASDDDLEEIALEPYQEETFEDACKSFIRQIKDYGNAGFFLGNAITPDSKWYKADKEDEHEDD